jgi:hypothetical protein
MKFQEVYMKVLVNVMPQKKEECLFYRKEMYKYNGREVLRDCCALNDKPCSFKNEESIFGGECRCLKIGLT